MKKLLLLIIAMSVASVAAAQDVCDPLGSVCRADVVTNVDGSCCSKGTTKKVNKCINNRIRKLRQARKIDPTWFGESVDDLKNHRDSSCDSSVVACSCATSLTISEFEASVTEDCCSKKFQQGRKNCLKNRQRKLRGAKGSLGEAFVNLAKANVIDELKTSDECGGGGQKNQTGCKSTISVNDGILTGRLWKPVADHQPYPVWLLAQGTSSDGCKVINKTGKTLDQLTYTGIANGGREHHRAHRRCSEYPNNILVSCRIDGKNVCHRVPDPCDRID